MTPDTDPTTPANDPAPGPIGGEPAANPADSKATSGTARKRGRPRKAAADKAPATPKADTTPKGTGAKPGPRSELDKLEAKTAETFAMLGMIVGGTLDQYDGLVIASQSEQIAAAFRGLAEVNPAVRRAMAKMNESSAYGGVIAALAGVVIPIAVHHGAIPRGGPVDALVAKHDALYAQATGLHPVTGEPLAAA